MRNQRNQPTNESRLPLSISFFIFTFFSTLTYAEINKKLDPIPEYTSSRSVNEEPLQIQKDLNIPQRSGNVFVIQKKILKEVGASESSFDTGGDDEDHDMD